MADPVTDEYLSMVAQMYAGQAPCNVVTEVRRLRDRVAELESLPDSAAIDEYGDWLEAVMGFDPDDRGEAVHTLRATLRAALSGGKDSPVPGRPDEPDGA